MVLYVLTRNIHGQVHVYQLKVAAKRLIRVLIKRARRDFIELLLENVSVFVGLLQHHRSAATGHGADLADCDYRYIHDCLQEDSRYRVMNRLHQWRDNAVRKFCHFLSHPSSANCPFKSRCADSVVGRRLAGKVLRNDATADVVNSYYNIFYPIVDCQVKVLIVGAEPLVHQMHRDFEAALTGSLFDYENTVVSVNFKCVSDREFSRFFSYVNEYEANGVIAAYSSKQSFNCVRDFVLHTLLDVDVVRASAEGSATVANRDSLGRLPVLILYACDPSHLEDMPFLQQQGCSFAESLGVQFVGLQQSPDDLHSAMLQEQKSFSMLTVEQVYRSISWLTHSAYVQYPGGGRISGREELPRPTARVLVCLMCGDDFDADLVVNPLVCKAARTQATACSESSCTGQQQQPGSVADALTSSVWSLCLNGGIGDRRFLMGDDDKEACTVQLDMFLPRACHRFHVACTITSYHYAIALTLKGLLLDGYILVYSPKRRASLANLDCVSRLLPSRTPTAFVAVGEVVDFFDAESNGLITEGAQLADQRNARFVSISRNSEASSGVYTPFFEDVWTTKTAAGRSRGSLASSSEQQSRSRQDGDAKESEYMTLSSFWSGSSSLPIVADDDGARTTRVTNGGQQRKADVAESVNNLFAKRFNESILGESTNEKRSLVVDKPVLLRQRQQCSSSSSALLLANGAQVPVVPPRRRVGDAGPQEQQRRSAVGRSVGDCRVETNVVCRTAFEASAPLATPESVEITSDSWITKSMQQLDEIPLRKTAADQKVRHQDGDDGCGHGSETAPPVRRKSLIGGPSIAERVRQLTSVLEVSSSSDAGVRSVPGTPTLHGQRERGDTVKSPFFFKTFVLPFRSSSEEYLTDQTDFVYFKGNGGGGGGGCSGGGVRVITESVQRMPCGGAISESHILPSTNLSTATAAASVSSPNFFVRKVASSFRIRKKKVADESKSLPQSPTADDRVFVLPSSRTPPREKRLSGDISAANALVNATTMLVSSRLMPANAAHRGLKVSEKSGKEKKAIKEQVGRRLASQVSDSVLKLRKSSASGPPGSSAQCKSLVSIETLCTESADDSFPVPPFVRKCVEFIEKEGLTTEGLYRVPGNHCQVSLIEQKFTERPDVPFDSLEVPVNAVTTALKNFFATLSEPLISCALYKPLIDAMAIEDRDERTRNLRIVFSQLPRANRATLRYFVDHLRCVARHVHTTAMDHRNIAKCLWPTLVRPEFDSFETMAMMTQTLEDLVLVLLDNPSIIDQ